MDAVFSLDAASRAEFLHLLMHSTGCTYICLWSYLPQPNCLMYWDGCYNEASIQPGALRLFLQYQRLVFQLENDQSGAIPGFAFRNNRPYIELGELELLNRASHQIQRQFYQEAGIKTVAFMGCRSGEIELGSSNVLQDMEMEMRSFFAQDFSRQDQPTSTAVGRGDPLPQPQLTDPNRPSSSSSSLRSLSTVGSPVPVDSSFIFTIPTASHPHHVPITDQTATPPPSSSVADPHHQAMQALSQMRSNIQLPTIESENAAMTRAILAVLTSPHSSSSSSTSHHSQPQQSQSFPDPNPNNNNQVNPNASAFKRYASSSSSRLGGGGGNPIRASLRAQSMLKRAIMFYRKHNLARHEHMLRSRPTSNQLHHMMSERKRREKLNESFHALRSLLPSGTKKDKASVLASTREHLAALKGQIAELSRRNQLLEAQLLPAPREAVGEASAGSSISNDDERFSVSIVPVSESTSQLRVVDLRVRVRGERSILDILIQLLEFLKLDRNVSLMSVDADTQLTQSGSANHVNLRLRIEGNGWDESTFLEAVRRLVADLAQ